MSSCPFSCAALFRRVLVSLTIPSLDFGLARLVADGRRADVVAVAQLAQSALVALVALVALAARSDRVCRSSILEFALQSD